MKLSSNKIINIKLKGFVKINLTEIITIELI